MAYVSPEMKSELAPVIKTILKKYGVKGSLAVNNHSTLVLNIKSGKIDFIKNHLEATEAVRSGHPEFNRTAETMRGYMQINTYHTDSQFSGKVKKFFAEVIAAMKGPKFFDHSDAMTDYFHVSHYIDINLGKWNKPYVLEK
jgi:hypothetical protein